MSDEAKKKVLVAGHVEMPNLNPEALSSAVPVGPPPLIEIILGEQTPKAPDLNEPPEVWIKTNKPILLEVLNFVSGFDNALGLSANQVRWKGNRLMKRFFVRRLGRTPQSPFELVINPTIIQRFGDPVTEFEGCLSWPGRTITAKRHLRITVSYWTIDGKHVENMLLERQDAQVWQHEMDHLEGIEENLQMSDKPIVRATVKAGRNDPCPCGSGKKFKKCCGK